MNTIWIIARKESAQMLRSQRGMLWLLAFSGLLSAFSLLLVSTTELSLLAVILGSDTYAGEKERATLVPLLCAPVAPDALLAGKAVGMLAAWGVMFAVATPYLWAVGASGQNLGAALFYLALFGTPVVLGFGYLAMALSARTGSFFGIPAQYGHIADAGRKSAGHRTRSARHCRRTHLGRDQPVCRSAQHLR